MLCKFGCGCISIKFFKSGEGCCSESASSCPAMKAINSSSVKEKRKGLGNDFWKNGHPKGNLGGTSHLKGKTYNEVYGIELALEKKQNLSIKAKNYMWYSKLSDNQKVIHANKSRDTINKRYESGWMPKAGRCKKYKYSSPIAGVVYLDGTWELATAKWLDARQYSWKRNLIRFRYSDLENKIRHYTPDFWVDELNTFIEIKGYETDLDRCKWSQFPNQLLIWKRKELKEHGVLP